MIIFLEANEKHNKILINDVRPIKTRFFFYVRVGGGGGGYPSTALKLQAYIRGCFLRVLFFVSWVCLPERMNSFQQETR